jgi:hypothetical protein
LSSPARGRKRKPKKDAAAAAASDLAVEDAAVREAIVRSLQADNALPLDAALAWSRQD